MARGKGASAWKWLLPVAGVGALLGALAWMQVRPPLLTEDHLREARERWQASGPVSYTLELELKGAIEDIRRIEVRDGRVVGMTTDGVEVAATAREYWSVHGLFGSMATELANAREPGRIFGDSERLEVTIRAKFDSRLGYPTFFLRHVSGSFRDVSWRVTSFEPL